MGVIEYAFLAYALTALISLLVIGVIVLINKVMSKSQRNEEV